MQAHYSQPPQPRPRSMTAEYPVNYPPQHRPPPQMAHAIPAQAPPPGHNRFPPPMQGPQYSNGSSRASSVSPTRRPLPAVAAAPAHMGHPVKHQSIDMSRFPPPQPPPTHSQSFVQMQAQRLQQYQQQQQQQQQQQIPRSRSPSPVKRRPSPPRFYGNAIGTTSNPPSPTKYQGQFQLPPAGSTPTGPPRSHGQIFAPPITTSQSQPSPTRSGPLQQQQQPVWAQQPPVGPPMGSPTRSQPIPQVQYPPPPPALPPSQQTPPQSQLQFNTPKSRLPNPILDPPSPSSATSPEPGQKFVPLWKRNANSSRIRGVNGSVDGGSAINPPPPQQMARNSFSSPGSGPAPKPFVSSQQMDRTIAYSTPAPTQPAPRSTFEQPRSLTEKNRFSSSSAMQSSPPQPRQMERTPATAPGGSHPSRGSTFPSQAPPPQPQQMARSSAFSTPTAGARSSSFASPSNSPERGGRRPLPSAPGAGSSAAPLPRPQTYTRSNGPSSDAPPSTQFGRGRPLQRNQLDDEESESSEETDDEYGPSDEDKGGFVHYVQQRQSQQAFQMDRQMGASDPGNGRHAGGPRGPSTAGGNNAPRPPSMSSVARSLPGTASTTLKFAAMSLDEQNGGSSGGHWPSDLPRLPRGPGSSFTSNGGNNIRQTSPRGMPNLDDEPPPSRPLSAASSVASSSAFGYTGSRHSPSGSSVSSSSYYQPRPQPPLSSFPPQTPPPTQPQITIESPKPLGGRDRVGQVDVKRIGREAEQADQAGSFSRPNSAHTSRSSRPRKPQSPTPTTEIPMINISGIDGGNSGNRNRPPSGGSVPMINISGIDDDDDPFGGPMINVSGPDDDHSSSSRRGGGGSASPTKIVFEVPGISIDNGSSGGIPRISVDDEDESNDHHDHHNHRRRPLPQQQQQVTPQPKPRGLICGGCHSSIVGRIVAAMGMKWHPGCFRCCVCDELLEHVSSYEGKDGRPYCHLDYHDAYAPRCYHCKTPIVEERFISLDDAALGKRTYHEQHFFCSECGDPFLSPSSASRHNRDRDYRNGGGEVAVCGDGFYEDDDVGFTVYKGYPYCEACHKHSEGSGVGDASAVICAKNRLRSRHTMKGIRNRTAKDVLALL
ncbi:hypothetical protein PQX77_015650 [Marasmius sp. AFHP31]|nr:hypothetical protein PQX77_015650 [Marasmius sp. AFHP31]